MNFSNFAHIAQRITEQFGESVLQKMHPEAIQPYAEIDPANLVSVCEYLHRTPEFYFDFLNCITAVDLGPEKNEMEVWYHLSAIPTEQSFIIKLTLARGTDEDPPEVSSISGIWKTAEWHEREAFDLLGVRFTGHPDLRRILLPADWHGHPLRKDYIDQETYHGIKIKY